MKTKKFHNSLSKRTIIMAFNRFRFSILLVMIIMSISTGVLAESNNNDRKGLFSHVNSWFARLRGNRDQTSNSQDEKKDQKKEEETTTMRNPVVGGIPGMPPGMFPHGMYGPMAASAGFGPAGFGMAPAPGPMFAMPTHQFAAHHHPPRMMHPGGPGGPPPPPGAGPGAFFGAPPMSSPFGPYSSGSHLIPGLHQDAFGPEGFAGATFGSPGQFGSDPSEPYGSPDGPGGPPGLHPHHHHQYHPHHHHHPSAGDAMDVPSNYDDSYNKKKK